MLSPADQWTVDVVRRRHELLGVTRADCGFVPIALSRFARLRRKLRRVIWASNLSSREFAAAIGVDVTTIENHLGGRRPCEARAAWYDRLESVVADGDRIIITLRRGQRGRKKCGWRKPISYYQDR